LFGLDIIDVVDDARLEKYSKANLTFEKIPFEDDFFDSVSAYDFLEHIPRVFQLPEQKITRFPFVEAMNEIWRVVKHNGLFYASTPCYPCQEIFVDPTHVNFITEKSHTYFTRPLCAAKMYGFTGQFDVVRVFRYNPRYEYEPVDSTLKQKWKKVEDRFKKRNTHILWEFRVLKA
jgi:SAM-dependent methyltransferase